MAYNPKRPELIQPYKPPRDGEDNGTSDLMQLAGFLCGFASMMFKYKWGVWASLFIMLSAFFTAKNRAESKQGIMNFTIVIMGLVSTYIWNIKAQMPTPNGGAPAQ
mmetsp:Transcript_29458/g.34046  ORF Transcript_29458/g.34046 Transcript_29458/m.34046 type:complete len:106 (+) Transcript_29458:53-370(+)|eukprot:CAMPEP_0176404918 /NCGR_PEP_ID=MMETSP0127-20121128/64_1 /TAXON_ID=938130 /ORGANISM="Platyophrya macrostoma, Strain WH" /LENGTH=105 /DNA_ID=CAMNT_0017783949 /DNA_START=46 /DNA_END=363 /DNA_ORIENTATION=+